MTAQPSAQSDDPNLPIPAAASEALPDPATARFPIVGIGASAGGLEAFTQLLTHLPTDIIPACSVKSWREPLPCLCIKSRMT